MAEEVALSTKCLLKKPEFSLASTLNSGVVAHSYSHRALEGKRGRALEPECRQVPYVC